MAQTAIRKALHDKDYSEIDKLMVLLQDPFTEHPDIENYAVHPHDGANQLSVSCAS